MIECRNCRGYFRTTPEKIGARCPKCKAPLFERADKQSGTEELGACAVHPGALAVLTCQRCLKNICAACRTKWHGEQLCMSCVELSLSRAEPNPRELRRQAARAVWSLALALIGVIVILLGIMIMTVNGPEARLSWPIFFAMTSTIPALFALGSGCPVVLARGPRFTIALSGIAVSGLHLGLFLGVLLINLWHN